MRYKYALDWKLQYIIEFSSFEENASHLIFPLRNQFSTWSTAGYLWKLESSTWFLQTPFACHPPWLQTCSTLCRDLPTVRGE